MRGVKEYEGGRADGGRRDKESDHGGPWIMRLSAVLCGRNMWAADGVSCRVIGSSNDLRKERHFHAGADRRRLGSRQKRNDAENKEQAHMSTPARAGRMSLLSLSPIVASVDVELGPALRGLEGDDRSAYLLLYPPGSHWTNSPCCWGFSTHDRFAAPLSHSALLTCRLSPCLLGGSRRVVSARLVLHAARSWRAWARWPPCACELTCPRVYPDFHPNVTGERIHPTVSLPCSNPVFAYSITSRLLYSLGTNSGV
jgi:hypothetical protein